MPSRRTFLATVTTGAVVGASGCAGVDGTTPSPGSDESTEWPLRNYDRYGAAYAPDAAVPRSDPGERFDVALEGSPRGRPVVAGGRVIQSTWAGIEAVDAGNGDRLWTFRDEDARGARYYPTPAVHGDTVYAGTERGFVALDAGTGEVDWRVDTDGGVTAAPVPGYDWDPLYVGTDEGEVLRVRADGKVDWRTGVYGEVRHLVTPNVSGVTAATTGGEVFTLYSGRGLWRKKVPGKVTALAARSGNDLFVATFGGGVLQLRTAAHAGRTAWHAEKGPVAEGTLALAGGGVFGGDLSGVHRLDADGGSVDWELGDDALSVAAAGDTLYVGTGGAVVARPLSGGAGLGGLRVNAERFRYDLGEAAAVGVTPADGALFAAVAGEGSDGRRLLALE